MDHGWFVVCRFFECWLFLLQSQAGELEWKASSLSARVRGPDDRRTEGPQRDRRARLGLDNAGSLHLQQNTLSRPRRRAAAGNDSVLTGLTARITRAI